MLFLTIFGKVIFQFIKVNWKCVFILIEFAHGTDVWKLTFFGLYMWSVWKLFHPALSNDWNNFYETTDNLQQFKADKYSTFFKSEAFTFSSASLSELIQFWTETLQHIERFSRPFCSLRLIENDSFLSVFSKAAFLSSIFFFRFSVTCRRVFNKTIILLGLAGYEMIITNSALRASLVIYHFISSAPS